MLEIGDSHGQALRLNTDAASPLSNKESVERRGEGRASDEKVCLQFPRPGESQLHCSVCSVPGCQNVTSTSKDFQQVYTIPQLKFRIFHNKSLEVLERNLLGPTPRVWKCRSVCLMFWCNNTASQQYQPASTSVSPKSWRFLRRISRLKEGGLEAAALGEATAINCRHDLRTEPESKHKRHGNTECKVRREIKVTLC